MGMRLVRLELASCHSGYFNEIFEALCNASDAVPQLRSLTMSIPFRNPWVLNALSRHFSGLTHLKLAMTFDEETTFPSTSSGKRLHFPGELSLQNLEILFLETTISCFDLTLWKFPKLHTFCVNALPNDWDKNIYPFLQRHANTIETLDLEDLRYLDLRSGIKPREVLLPIGFWDEFEGLKLLRINLRYVVFPGPPKKDHPLRYLVDTNPINNPEVIRPYEDNDSQRKALIKESLESLCISDLEEPTSTIVRKMAQNGVWLVDNNGERLLWHWVSSFHAVYSKGLI